MRTSFGPVNLCTEEHSKGYIQPDTQNHIQKVTKYIGTIVQVHGGRRVKITGYGPTGSAACEAADGGEPIFEVSTAFLVPQPEPEITIPGFRARLSTVEARALLAGLLEAYIAATRESESLRAFEKAKGDDTLGRTLKCAGLVSLISHMKTLEEFGEEQPGNDDYVDTLDNLIAESRRLRPGVIL